MEKTLAPQRKEWLDALRGLAMLLVVLGHSIPGSLEKYFFVLLTSPVKIPLFFAISGYVFNPRDSKQGAFYLNLLRKIVIPSVFLFLCTRVIHIPTRGIQYVTSGLMEFLSGDTYWYISACVLGEILFFYTLKFCKAEWQIILTAMLCWALGFVLDAFGIGDFAMLNRAFIAQFFLLMGYLFRIHQDFFKKLHWSALLGGFLVAAALIAAGYFLWPGRGIDVYMNNYYGSLLTVPFAFILIAVFTLSLMTLGIKRGNLSKVLAFAGRHTLITYIFHSFFLKLAKRIIPLGDSTGFLLLGKCILLACFSVGVCSLCGVIVNWVFPELMGRRRKKKEKV